MSNYCLRNYFLLCVLMMQVLCGLQAQNVCTNNRYTQDIFEIVEDNDYAAYGEAPSLITPYLGENATFDQTLRFDLYRPDPSMDTLTKRPLILIAFGGAFVVGFKEQPQIVDFCRAMARKGYVAVSIDYRLSFNAVNQQSAVRAVYRAAQDLKAAVRYFRYHATDYGIDPDLIFAGGNSAGGISALHAAYVSETERAGYPLMEATYEVPQLINDWPDLGCTECSGNEYGQAPYNISGTPNGVISLWGAIIDVNFMESANDAPVICFHGTDDFIVNVDTGAPFDVPLFPALSGTIPIGERAEELDMYNEVHLYDGDGHEVWFDEAKGVDIQGKNANFWYNYIKPTTPTISGVATVCGGSIHTYSMVSNVGSVYCWEVQGGSIVSADPTLHTVDIEWDMNPETSPKIDAREFNCHAAQSDLVTLLINIIPVTTPNNVSIVDTGLDMSTISWDATVGLDYVLQYRPVGTGTWITENVSASTSTINNLIGCTDYEVQVQATCDNTVASAFSASTTFTTSCLKVQAKLFLEGVYDANTMFMSNSSIGILPNTQPYNRPPWNYFGTESASVLPNNAVDWVLLEIRDVNNGNTVGKAAGLLLSDGMVQGVDGAMGLQIPTLTQNGNYQIIVRHRNHVDVMSNPLILPNTSPYDFSSAMNQAVGEEQQIEVAATTGVFGLIAGDITGDGVITYIDFNAYAFQAANALNTYSEADCNLDTQIDNTDFNVYFNNVGQIGIDAIRY